MSPKMDVISVDFSQDIVCPEATEIDPIAQLTVLLHSSDFTDVPAGCVGKLFFVKLQVSFKVVK